MTHPVQAVPVTRILIVEDEILLAEDLAGSLEDLGYEIMGRVSSTEEAARMLRESQPDLVLMDIHQEDSVGGNEAANRISSSLDAAVVYLTDYSERDVVDGGEPVTPHASLTKPVSLRELHRAVETALYKHRADKKIREGEQRYRRILETIREVYFEVLRDGTILEVSPSVERVLGYRREDLIGSPFIDIAADPELQHRFVEAGNRERTIDGAEIIAEKKDGTTIPCSINFRAIYDEPGMPGKICGTLRETTDRKDTGESLKAALEGMRRADLKTKAYLNSAKAVLEHRDFDAYARMLFDNCKKVLGAMSGYVALLNENGSENEVIFLDSGGLPCTVDPSLPMPIRGLRNEAYRTGKVVYDNDFLGSKWMEFMPEGHVALENVLFAPIRVREKVVGLLGLANKPHGFSETDAEIAQEFGELAAVGLSNHLSRKNLEENEERFRLLYEHAPLPYQSLDETGLLIEVNQTWLDAFGITRDEAIGKRFEDVLTKECQERFRADFNRFIDKGRCGGVEFDLVRKDGSRFLASFDGRVSRDELGRLKQTHCIFHDVTDLRRAEEDLRESRQRLEILFDALEDFVFVIDEEAQILEVNAAVVGRLGFSEDELSEMTVFDLHPPERRREAGTIIAEILDGKTNVCPIPLVTKDGTIIPVETKVARGTWGGRNVVFGISRDISDRLEAEETLRRHNEFLSSVLESMTHPFYVINADDYTIELSNTAAVSSEIPKGTTCYSVNHNRRVPCNGSEHPCPLAEVKRTGQPVSLEHVHHDKEGRAGNYAVHAYPIFDDQGRVSRVIEYCLDVTARVEAEEALRESERTLNTILSMSPSGIGYFREGRLVWANKAMMRLFGDADSAEEDFLGKSPREFYESDQEFQRVRKIFQAQIAEGQPTEAEARLRRRDGSVFVGNVSFSSRRTAGVGQGTTVVISDVTGRKAAEEERLLLMTAIEQAAETIVITDHEGTIKYVNPSFERVSGFARGEALGRNLGMLKSGEHDEKFYKEMWTTLIRGDVWRGHLINRKRDGKFFEEEATISPIKDEFGKISNYVAVKRDVTDQMLLEKQLQQAQKMESIGTLAGGIAHDFNNLLQIVLGYADIVMMGKSKQSPDVRNLTIIRKAATDGRELVKGLLTFSRQVESELRPVNLNQQLKRFQTVLRRTIPRMIEIDLSLADDVHTLNADPIQLEQVLLNLAVNAHHAMPKGGKLGIETENVTLDEEYCKNHLDVKPGEYVLLRIADTGHGMKKEIVEHIFEPFYTTKGAGEGTGLGLSIVYGIVKNHGGHITCSSQPGQGTVFTICLPVFRRQAVRDGAVKVKETPLRGTETILLADDEDHVRDMFERTLTRNGYRVISAANGSLALGIYREKTEEIDLVILDLIMPEMGGEQCLEEILKLNPAAKVFVASGYSGKITSNKIMEAGAIGFLAKPFDVRDFLREVRKILDETGSRGSRAKVDRTGRVRIAGNDKTPAPEHILSSAEPIQMKSAVIEESTERLRILAIDDREPYLIMLEAGLAQFGQTPLTAGSGTEGLRIFHETPVDLVICDLEMPDLAGWEVAGRIKEACREKGIPKTPVILLTGRTDMEDMHQEQAERMADCGVDAILGKPIDIPEILAIAGKLLRKADRNIPNDLISHLIAE